MATIIRQPSVFNNRNVVQVSTTSEHIARQLNRQVGSLVKEVYTNGLTGLNIFDFVYDGNVDVVGAIKDVLNENREEFTVLEHNVPDGSKKNDGLKPVTSPAIKEGGVVQISADKPLPKLDDESEDDEDEEGISSSPVATPPVAANTVSPATPVTSDVSKLKKVVQAKKEQE